MKNPWNEAAECLRVLSHPHRLQMVDQLLLKDRSVGELAETCKIHSHVASEHLMLLKTKGLLSSRREARRVIYSIQEEMLALILQCIKKRFFEV